MSLDRPEHEIYQRRGKRNLWLGLVLGGFVALVFGVTIVKLAGSQGFRGEARIPGTQTIIVEEGK